MKLENAHAKRSITAKSVATRIVKWGNGQRGASVRVVLLADGKVDPALQNHSLRDMGKDVQLTTYNMHHAKRNRVNAKNGYYGDLCQDRDCTLTSWTAWSRCTPCPGKCEWDACPKSVRTDEYRSRQRGVKIHNAGAGRCEGERRQSAYCGYCKMTCFLNYLPTGNMAPTRCAQYNFVRDYQEPRK